MVHDKDSIFVELTINKIITTVLVRFTEKKNKNFEPDQLRKYWKNANESIREKTNNTKIKI